MLLDAINTQDKIKYMLIFHQRRCAGANKEFFLWGGLKNEKEEEHNSSGNKGSAKNNLDIWPTDFGQIWTI